MPEYIVNDARKACDTAFDSGNGNWAIVLNEEVAEVLCEPDDAKRRSELVQTAAVAAAWWERV